MTRSHVAFGPSYILIALVRGPSQTHVLAGRDARTCKDGCTYLRGRMHVLAWRDAMCCLTLPQTHALFASNACPLCLKRYHPPLQTLSSVPANVIIRSCKRYHPPPQTFASDSGFFFRVTLSQVWSSSRSVDFVLDRAVCVGAAERCL